MRQLALAAATLTTLTLVAATAQADSYYGPIKVGNQCWVRQLGNSLGYWKTCDSGGTAQAAVARSGKKK